jgi:hypothetical protein
VKRPLRSVTAALVAFGMLAGCASIPTSGGVQSAEIETDPDDISSTSLPEGPQPGQEPSQLLQGFIRAGRGPQNNYQIAHDFLAPGTSWNGADRVLVTTSQIQPVVVDEDTVSVTLTVVAEVDAGGRYVELPSPSTQTLEYDFTVVDDEWRIVDPPPGTVLSRNGFSATFDAYSLYFFDPSFRFLVPDVRWFAQRNTRAIANRIVTELLAGPAPWLGSGVLLSAFPVGTTGRADPSDSSGVDIDLSSGVRAESATAQLRMIQQLRASLRSIATVSETDIAITAEGLALAPAPEEAVPPDSRYLVRGEVIGGIDGVVGSLGVDGVVVPLPTIQTRADDLGAVAASLSRDRTALAVLGRGGVSLVTSEGPQVVDDRAGLIAPTIDPFGFVWSVPAQFPGGLQAMGDDGIPHPLPIAADGTVRAIELSRDGSRLLVALDTATGPRLLVIGVVRDAELAPVSLNTPFELRSPGTALDVAWVDGERIAVLVDGETDPSVQVLVLGGPSTPLGSVDEGVAIVGGNGEEGLRVLTADGSVLRFTSVGNWAPTTLLASFLGTQQ